MLKERAEQAPKAAVVSKKKPGGQRQGIVETMAKSAARSIGSQIATQYSTYEGHTGILSQEGKLKPFYITLKLPFLLITSS
jgi:hypothetical protein